MEINITEKLKSIQIQLENSDQHISRYQELLKSNPQNGRYYQWELEREIDYKKHLNYQVESLKRIYENEKNEK